MDSAEVLYRLILIKARRAAPSTERVTIMARESELLEFESTENSNVDAHINAIRLAVSSGANGSLPELQDVLHLQRVMMPDYPLAGHLRGSDLTMIDVNSRRVCGTPPWAIETAYRKLFSEELSFCLYGMALHPTRPLPYHALARFHKEFEDIHGLWDGNGRVGRVLVHWLKAYLDSQHAIKPGHICLLSSDRPVYLQLLADCCLDGLADLLERRTA